MAKLFLRYTNYLKWSAILLGFSFTMGLALNSIAFLLFVLIGITTTIIDIVQQRAVFKFQKTNFILIVLFIVICLRELSLDISAGSSIAFAYIAFIAIPVIIGFQADRVKKYKSLIFQAFLFGCLINVSVNLFYAVYRGIIINEAGINFWYFTYEFFSEPFRTQPIYLGYFYLFALFILNSVQSLRQHSLFFYSAFSVLVLGIFLLAARNAIVSLLVLLPLYLLIQKQISIKKVIGIALIFVGAFLLAIQNPVIKNRVLKVNKKGNFYSGSSLRANIWESAYIASQENIVWGSGEERGKSLLLREYETRSLKTPLKYQYHAHNQYLQIVIQYGIIGLLVLLGSYLWPFIRVINEKEYLGLFWIVLFSITSITESVFTRQWGVLSFAFFSCLFLCSSKVQSQAKT